MVSRLGGRHQRAARASGSASSGVGERADIVAMAVHGSPMWRESEQAQALLYKWAWGHMSATEVQATAKRQYADELAALRRAGVANLGNFATPAIKVLSQLGALLIKAQAKQRTIYAGEAAHGGLHRED